MQLYGNYLYHIIINTYSCICYFLNPKRTLTIRRFDKQYVIYPRFVSPQDILKAIWKKWFMENIIFIVTWTFRKKKYKFLHFYNQKRK